LTLQQELAVRLDVVLCGRIRLTAPNIELKTGFEIGFTLGESRVPSKARIPR